MDGRYASSSEDEDVIEVNQRPDDNFEATITHEVDEEPKVGMKFSSEANVIRYYTNYAQHKGFGVAKISTKNRGEGKKIFHSSNSKNMLKPNPITKTQCMARLNASLCLDGSVIISRVVLEHNHELSPTKARYFRCNKNLAPHIKRRLELNDQAGIKVSGNFRSLVVEGNGYENLTFGEKDCYIDKVRRLRLGTGDAEAIQNYFVRKQNQNSQFYYVMDVDDESRLRNVFWADARCRAAYEYFGEVVTFDTTYLTNKYDMPFAPFVGVNHHGQSVLLGCALVSNEDTKTFTWLFTTWLECMSGRAPNAIVTDQDKAMKNAIQIVFPNARHRWCLWHIMKKVPIKLGKLANYESLKALLHSVVYDSLSKRDFEEKWEKMVEDYNLKNNEWLGELFHERHRWVPVFVKDTFWAGMSTTQRSESMNSFFDGYVNSKTTLKQFVEQYDNALRDKIEKENIAVIGSFNTVIACVSHFGFESQFQKAFTNSKFKEFQVEVAAMMYCNTRFERSEGFKSIFFVVESKKICDKIKDIRFHVSFDVENIGLHCTCCLFEFKGILCRHILCVLKLTGKTDSVPLEYVFSQWRKDVKRRHTLIKCGFDNLAKNAELQRLNKACDAFHEVAFVVIHTDDDLKKMMTWIKDLRIEFTCKETSPRMDKEPFVNQDSAIPKQASKILDPIVARCKGRPPSKRKVSKADQIVKKKLARKRTQKSSQNIDHSQEQDLYAMTAQENGNEGILGSQVAGEISTHDSTQCEHNFFWSGQDTSSFLAPFNPNLDHISEVPYYPQIINNNVTYYDFLQAQHHMNMQPLAKEMTDKPQLQKMNDQP